MRNDCYVQCSNGWIYLVSKEKGLLCISDPKRGASVKFAQNLADIVGCELVVGGKDPLTGIDNKEQL